MMILVSRDNPVNEQLRTFLSYSHLNICLKRLLSLNKTNLLFLEVNVNRIRDGGFSGSSA